MRNLKQELAKIPAGLARMDVLEKAKEIAAERILEIIESKNFPHFNLKKLKPFEKRREIIGLYGDTFDNVSQNIIFLLIFIYWLHDIGYAKKGIDIDHGKAGVMLLEDWGVLQLFDVDLRFIISYAIENHSILKLPDLPPDANETEKIADIFARILRDWDKLGGFVNKLDGWLADESIKQKEIIQWKLVGETNVIKPEVILVNFEKFLPINNEIIKNGGSYEAATLLYFSWFFDIDYQETLDFAIKLGIPDKFMKYFKKQLIQDPRQYEIIKKSFGNFLEANGF